MPVDPRAPVQLLGICGSLRRGSTNAAILRAAADLAPADVVVVIHPLHDVPMFDADLEADPLPAGVQHLRAAATRADGLLLATPEYNWSISGAMKNAIDWLSRGPASPLDEIPAALLSGAGGSGGRRAQTHLRDVLGHNQVDVLDEAVQIARAVEHVQDGRLVTPEHRDAVAELVASLAAHVRQRRARAQVA